MIKRDEYGIICQHSLEDPTYLDGGDSASRTGIMALCYSSQDISLLPEFFALNIGLVRHPHQEAWDEATLTSRDQLVMYAAGCRAPYPQIAAKLVQQYTWHINKDLLMPDVRSHLRLCAGLPPSLLGTAWLRLSIYFQAYAQPKAELNQLACMAVIAGPWAIKLLCRLMPDWKSNIATYWGGWRNQAEIGSALISKIESFLR